MPDSVLMTLARGAPAESLDRVRGGSDPSILSEFLSPVERDGRSVSTAALVELFKRFLSASDEWPERARSDAWLAPRVHWALRLTRREASDKGVWAYLANVVSPDYVTWRWSGQKDGKVATNRWMGPHHKQAIARLWWGAELFRNGADYGPVVHLFANQDFPNSYIHRVFTRARPLALGLIEATWSASSAGLAPTSDQINDVARKVNLCTAARSVDAATGYHRDDVAAYGEWVEDAPGSGVDFTAMPVGPHDGGVRPDSLDRGAMIGADICSLAGLEPT